MTTPPLDFAAWSDAFEEAAERVEGVARPWSTNRLLLRTVGSTNALARRIADEYAEEGIDLRPALLVAFEQTAGRGRQGRTWSSPPGAGAYVTLLWPLPGPEVLPNLPLVVPVALAAALDRHLPAARPAGIKWPNDLLVGGRKIGGVLIDGLAAGEGGGAGVALIGFGVNRAQVADELAGLGGAVPATSLAVEAPPAPPAARLVWDLVTAVAEGLADAGDRRRAVAAYARRSVHRPGDPVRCRTAEETLEGRFRGFDERGFLRLELTRAATGRRSGEEVLMRAGEVVPG